MSGHVRDSCMKFLGISNCKLSTRWLHVENVSESITLRAKGTPISEPQFSTYPLRDAIFPTRERGNGLCRVFFFEKAVFPFSRGSREGANREKLTVKKIINNEMFFFTVYVPYKPWKIGVNREEIGTKPWKNRHQKSTIFSPLVFHRLRLLEGEIASRRG